MHMKYIFCFCLVSLVLTLSVTKAEQSADLKDALLKSTLLQISDSAKGFGNSPEFCAPQVMRAPGSNEKFSLPSDLLNGIQMFKTGIKSAEFNRETCAPFLKNIYTNLLRTPPEYFDQKKLKEDANAIVQELFTTKLELRKRLRDLEGAGPVSDACISALRDIFRASLFMTEYITEQFIPGLGHDVAFEGSGPELLLNPEFGPKLELRSGDVLLSRGNAFVSGAIARIGDDDGNFSHAATVYVDPSTKKTYVVEAHIEVGSTITPLEKYLTDGKLRAVVFRQKDPVLAEKASKTIFDRVKKASASGKNVPYDFGMVLESREKGKRGDEELFCSEIVYSAYKTASDGKLLLPKYPTGLHPKNNKFLKDIGVLASETFAPSDMELETRFEEVAEWRNFKKTQRARMIDSVLTKTYEFMNEKNYALKNTPEDMLKRDMAYAMRHLPLFSNLVKDKFPQNMTRRALGTMLALDKVAAPMLERLKQASDEQKIKTGYPFTAAQMGTYLDQLREKDYQTYLARQKYEEDVEAHKNDESWYPPTKIPPESLFHKRFGPGLGF